MLLVLAIVAVGVAAPATASPDEVVAVIVAPRPVRATPSPRVEDMPDVVEEGPQTDGLETVRDSRATSTGWPWSGRLLDAVRLQPTEHVHLVDADVPAGRHYGTVELVGLIGRVAAHVAHAAPGAQLQVGELSGERGGNIPGHRSHENGRDVDLGFYFVDAETGEPVNLTRFVNQTRRGAALEGRRLRFDDERNWQMLVALATDEVAPVQHAFVHRELRARLLRVGKRLGASAELLERVERIVISPGVAHPHRNHFHVRIYCPAEDVTSDRRSTCRDRGPYWPWLPSAHPWQARVVPLPGYPPREEVAVATPRRRTRTLRP
ncbi:MAG: penicillin-insensitive murein endopeptidase [Sandaracinus sp.]|nr:penicillin-insensitive murein endopeptidase [Sandaracinus sp.]